jgi:RND family efflux transporter MFP subunit
MALMRPHKGFWALLVLLLGGGLAYVLLVGKPGPEPELAIEPATPTVDVVVAAPRVRSLSVQTQGTVRPLREITLVSQVGGRVESASALFTEGSFFRAGEPLLKIEDIDYQLVIARAESNVAEAMQRLAEEQGRALQSKREWRDLGSEQANELFLRKPQLASAEAGLKASRADLAAAKLDLARTSISAPFNGRVSEKFVDIGQFVAPGTAIATVYDTEIAQVRLPLTGRQVALLDLPLIYENQSTNDSGGAPVLLRAGFANKMWEWQGRIVRTDASIDESSRLVYAVAEVDKPFAHEPGNPRPPLVPGLFVEATITGRPLPDVSLVPQSALRTDGNVMIVDVEQRALLKPVQVLQSNDEQVWVQGLEAGERVIIRESARIVEGMQVSVNSVPGLDP